MKKTNTIPDKTDVDSKRLFKSISEGSILLDQSRARARKIQDLFSALIESQRYRLCSYGEKLMFAAPVEYGKKCEDILWRKCFYEFYATLKHLKMQDTWTEEEIGLALNTLNSGIGFYHRLIMKLQEQFDIDVLAASKFPLDELKFGLQSFRIKSGRKPDRTDTAEAKWAHDCGHRCLVYMGDLNRYMYELQPGGEPAVSMRYYLRAAMFAPALGMPHNQLGTLANTTNRTLEAVYRYFRCLACDEPFEGAEGNLISIMEQHPAIGFNHDNFPFEKRVFSQFLHLVGVWFLQKSPIKDPDQLVLEFIQNIQIWFPNLEENVSLSLLKQEPSSLADLMQMKSTKSFDLSEYDNTVFKILVIFIVCHHQMRQSSQKANLISPVTTVIVAVISYSIQFLVNVLKNSLNVQSPSELLKLVSGTKSRRRRRRRGAIRIEMPDDSSSDSDSFDSDNLSDEYEEALVFDKCSKTKLMNGHGIGTGKFNMLNGMVNGDVSKTNEKLTKREQLANLLLKQESILKSIKISCDWLQCNIEIMNPVSSWKAVLENLATLLNFLSPYVSIEDKQQLDPNVPLMEDIELKELPALSSAHQNLDWKSRNLFLLDEQQEMKNRVARIMDFGKSLAKMDNSIFIYDFDKNWFSVREVSPVVESVRKPKMDDEKRGKLMKEMGQLWLEAEVKNLECKVNKSTKVNLLTPYLVIDCEALIQHYVIVKKLITSGQFVVLVPTAVISALDEFKRTSSRARESIRWLEQQLRQGNQYLRLQKDFEKRPLPSIAYPRKRDGETWVLVQMMECCHYLNYARHNNRNGITDVRNNEGSNFARLLTGSRSLANSYNDPSKQMNFPLNLAAVKSSTGDYIRAQILQLEMVHNQT